MKGSDYIGLFTKKERRNIVLIGNVMIKDKNAIKCEKENFSDNTYNFIFECIQIQVN